MRFMKVKRIYLSYIFFGANCPFVFGDAIPAFGYISSLRFAARIPPQMKFTELQLK